ncbi:Cell-division-associated, ABC-transporter-like signaling protein FtsE, partial [Mycolicibacterium hippocampi]|nr:Cell-division-associated, ABC-transporter-like signaling protein FtsE [Mycolicibacterium hippocampi]
DLLERINRTGTTVLMATHDHHIVDSMRQRVVELELGRLIRDELLTRDVVRSGADSGDQEGALRPSGPGATTTSATAPHEIRPRNQKQRTDEHQDDREFEHPHMVGRLL